MKSRWISWWLCVAVPGSTCLAADHLNVLFITVDDMNRDSVGVYGSKVPGTTPNIDQLASEGTAVRARARYGSDLPADASGLDDRPLSAQ